jgi:hypothetical protein
MRNIEAASPFQPGYQQGMILLASIVFLVDVPPLAVAVDAFYLEPNMFGF